jgi:hypothetical protein
MLARKEVELDMMVSRFTHPDLVPRMVEEDMQRLATVTSAVQKFDLASSGLGSDSRFSLLMFRSIVAV